MIGHTIQANPLRANASAYPTAHADLTAYPADIEQGVLSGQFQVGVIPEHQRLDSRAYRPLFGEQMDLYSGNDRPWFKADHARAEREGWHVVATHADEGVSGST